MESQESPTQPSTAEQVATTTATEPLTKREEIYKKYQEIYGEDQKQEQVLEPAKEVKQEAAPTEPSPSTNETLELIKALQSEVTALKEQLKPKPTPQPPPAGFWELAKEGKLEEAEKALIDKAKSATASEVQQNFVDQALEVFEAKLEIKEFLSEVKAKNPDLTSKEPNTPSMEEYISAMVGLKMAQAQDLGQIKSIADYVKVYKSSVNSEVEKARKILQLSRAAGKTDAMTTRKEVLSMSTIAPNGVDTSRQANPDAEETVSDYIAKRQALQLSQKGM